MEQKIYFLLYNRIEHKLADVLRVTIPEDGQDPTNARVTNIGSYDKSFLEELLKEGVVERGQARYRLLGLKSDLVVAEERKLCFSDMSDSVYWR